MVKKCHYCGANEIEKEFVQSGFQLIRCNSCGLLQTDVSKNLTKKINTTIYSLKYLSNYEKRTYDLIKRFRYSVNLLEKYKNGGKLLDVGCSTGIFIKSVEEYGKYKWKLMGIDINKSAINIAKHNSKAEYYTTSLNKQIFKENSLDCITCFDVLEHDRNLSLTLKNIHRILKKNGLVIIQCPNYKSVMAAICGSNWDWWSVPDHIYHFSLNDLKRIILDNNFRIIYSKTWQPMDIYLLNIRGTIKNKLPRFMKINAIVSKCIYYFLYIIYPFVDLLQTRLNLGGLSYIVAYK